jgi:small subunit ribosomal protein S17
VKRGQRKTAIGIVTSDKMNRTITVETERRVQHPRFRKYVRAYTRYKVHDVDNQAREGDKVLIMETRPVSKTKRWRLVEILARAHGADVQ